MIRLASGDQLQRRSWDGITSVCAPVESAPSGAPTRALESCGAAAWVQFRVIDEEVPGHSMNMAAPPQESTRAGATKRSFFRRTGNEVKKNDAGMISLQENPNSAMACNPRIIFDRFHMNDVGQSADKIYPGPST